MKKYYEEKKYNVAFERCINIMSRLMQNNGTKVLRDITIENILKITGKQEQRRPDSKVVASRLQSYYDRYKAINRNE